jgi:hypothetical protein
MMFLLARKLRDAAWLLHATADGAEADVRPPSECDAQAKHGRLIRSIAIDTIIQASWRPPRPLDQTIATACRSASAHLSIPLKKAGMGGWHLLSVNHAAHSVNKSVRTIS